MTFPRSVLGVAAVWLLLVPAPLAAQARDGFAAAVAALVDTVGDPRGADPSALATALGAMAAALEQWDDVIAGVEGGLAANIGAAPGPVAARMRTALGAAYLERGRAQDAVAQFDLAATLDPAFADAPQLRGVAYTLARAPERAAASFRSAWLAESAAGRPDTAYLLLRSSSRSIPAAERDRATAVLLDGAGRVGKGGGSPVVFMTLDLLDEESVESPVFVPARYGQAFGLLRDARYDEGLAALTRASDVGPLSGVDDERRHLSRAETLVATGDLAGAREAYHEATVAVPGSGLAHWALGQLHLRFADERSAARSFEAAAALGPFAGARHVYAALGRLYHNQLELDLAAQAYERRVDSAPNDSGGHVDLGDVYRAQDRLDEALVEFLVAALLDPSSARPFAQAGQVLASSGRDDEAVTLLEAAVRRDPGHLEARYALARALLRLGRTEAATAELRTFEELQEKAMAEERRRFEENARRIDETLATGVPEPRR